MACCSEGNQTTEAVLKVIQDALSKGESALDSKIMGTGIFAVVDPSKGLRHGLPEYRKELIPNLSYSECVARGRFCTFFKFIPNIVRSHEDLKGDVSAMRCGGGCYRGSIDCGPDMSCICDTGRQTCF